MFKKLVLISVWIAVVVQFSSGKKNIQLLRVQNFKTEHIRVGLVRFSVINMRKTLAHNAELLSQAVMGTPVRILKDSNDWILIQTPDKYMGWVTSLSIVNMSADQFQHWKRAERMMFIAHEGSVYSDTLKTGYVSDLVMSSIVVRLHVDNNWTEVQLPDGRNGFVENKQLVSFSQWAKQISPDGEKLSSLARQFMGIPYLWGGASTKFFDCSGFVKTLYFMQGLILDRNASGQFLQGLPVDRAHKFNYLKQGDLLFFGFRSKGKPHPTHVGMYIGNMAFIHESDWVHVNSLDPNQPDYSEYYVGRLVGVRRFIFKGNEKFKVIYNNWYF